MLPTFIFIQMNSAVRICFLYRTPPLKGTIARTIRILASDGEAYG